jgi:O-antigen ligase
MPKNLPKYLLFTTLLALPAYIFRFSLIGIPTTALEMLIYLSFLSHLAGKNIKWRSYYWYPVIFVAFAFLSALVDPSRTAGLGLWKAYFFDGLLVFLMVASLEKRDHFEAMFYLILGGLLTSLAAMSNYFSGIRAVDGRIYDLDKISPNYLAMYLSPLLVGSALYCVEAKNRRWLVGFSGLIILFALILTQSRGAILAIAGGLVFALGFYLSGKFSKSKVLKFLPLFLILIVLAGTFFVFKPDWTDHGRKATSSNIRYYIWQTSTEIIGKNPVLGVGLSNYQNYFSNLTKDRVNFPEFISPQALSAHNIYLQLFAVGGIGLLASFIAFVVSTEFWSVQGAVFSATLVSILCYGLVDTPIFKNDLAILFFAIIALVGASAHNNKKE